MTPVVSENIRAVGYRPSTRTLRVQFHSGGVYDYFDVNVAVYEQMLLPRPWRRVGRLVRAHNYRRIAA